MILGFAGKIGVGKTTTSEWFVENHNFVRLSYGEPIKKALVEFTGLSMNYFTDPVLKEKEIPGLPGITPRIMMQKLGTDYARNMIFGDYFLWRMEQAIKQNPGKNVVIDDVRFDNEANFIRERGGTMIQLFRDFESPSKEQSHASEKGITMLSQDRVVHCLESPETTASFIWSLL